MKKLLESNHGGALMIVLGLMLMLTVAAIMAVHTAQTDIDLSFNQLHYDQAFYVADAGLKQTLLTLNQDNAWNSAYVAVTFEEGEYTVAVEHERIDEPIQDTVYVRSTGVVDQAQANLRAIIVPELVYPFQFAMFGEDSVKMDQSTESDSYDSDVAPYDELNPGTDGDVASNGTVVLDNTATVNGDATSSVVGGVTVCATCTVTDSVFDGVEPYVLDPIDDSRYIEAAADNDNLTGIAGDYDGFELTANSNLVLGVGDIATLTQDSGVYFFNNITLEENSQLRVAPGISCTIYMLGTLSLENNTSVNITGDPADLLIYSKGTVTTVGNDTEIHAAFIGPDADVILKNDCEWYGSIIAGSVVLFNNVDIHYDSALDSLPTSTTGRMMMVAWEEE